MKVAENFEYIVNNGEVTITGYTGNEKQIMIPERVGNLPVATIGEQASSDGQLTSVTIPANVNVAGIHFPKTWRRFTNGKAAKWNRTGPVTAARYGQGSEQRAVHNGPLITLIF
ncbi:MAG: hypothetical protein LBK66_08155 [Spirochaetaceae bacterium]|nr:hypothetical protein [Spirochaetaceae bacterium]